MVIPPSFGCVIAWSLVWLAIEPEGASFGVPFMIAAWGAARIITVRRRELK